MIGDRIVVRGDGTHFFLDGEEVTEKAYRRRHPPPNDDGPQMERLSGRGWPIISDALAVHAKTVAEAEANAAAKGVPTEFLKDGRPVLRDRAHRKAYLKAYGFHDRDGGYGD